MPRTDVDEVYQNGVLVSSTTVVRPTKAITDAEFAQAKATLRNMVGTFFQGGQPTGSPTNAQLRNWLLALTVDSRYVRNELDTDT